MTDRQDRVAKARDIIDGTARARSETAWDPIVDPADGLVVVERTVANGEGPGRIVNGAADAGAAGADAGRTTDGLVTGERKVLGTVRSSSDSRPSRTSMARLRS
jgi:hypothetical protein